jgi:hypothetical protein
MAAILNIFGSICLLVFSIGTIIGGLFTTYFGSGKSRMIGGILIIIGLVAAVIFYNFTWGLWGDPVWAKGIVIDGIIAIIGAVVGGAISLGVLLAGIMKA